MLAAPATVRQKRVALVIALVADALQIALAPLFAEGSLSPFADALDLAVAAALLLTLGWRWRTVLALGVELIPGVALFPTWTAMAATISTAPAQEILYSEITASRRSSG